jgi:hypothetical protein
MEVRVNVLDRRQPPQITGTTIVDVGDEIDPTDGNRRISLTNPELEQLGGRVMRHGISYAGEPDIVVVIPVDEANQTPSRYSIFE